MTPLLGIVPVLAGCVPREADLDRYVPVARADWEVSTPAAEGVDETALARLYGAAEQDSTVYGVLVARNGRLVTEGYFNHGSIDERGNRQSVTKSYVSALVGLAIAEGCIDGVDATMLSFFPELEVTDPRKGDITIEHMLQMRAGYPWEETDPAYWDAILSQEYVRRIEDFPLLYEPGSRFEYSNLTSTWLSVIVERACEEPTREFAQRTLFEPLGAVMGQWKEDKDGYEYGMGELGMSARDMARFGQLYLNEGMHDGKQVLSADWVEASLDTVPTEGGRHAPEIIFDDYGYGYQWWSGGAGDHEVHYARGHGGIFIHLVRELDLVLVITADPQYLEHDEAAWRHEKAHLRLGYRFLAALP